MQKSSLDLSWYGILQVARQIRESGNPLTSETLRKVAHIPDGDKKSPNKNASAWLAKFLKWGYIEKIGSLPGEGKKPFTTYALTKYGQAVKPTNVNRLSRLISAVRALEQARGGKGEPAAYADLIQTCDEIEKVD